RIGSRSIVTSSNGPEPRDTLVVVVPRTARPVADVDVDSDRIPMCPGSFGTIRDVPPVVTVTMLPSPFEPIGAVRSVQKRTSAGLLPCQGARSIAATLRTAQVAAAAPALADQFDRLPRRG